MSSAEGHPTQGGKEICVQWYYLEESSHDLGRVGPAGVRHTEMGAGAPWTERGAGAKAQTRDSCGIKEKCGAKAVTWLRQGGPITQGHIPTRESGVYPGEKWKFPKKKRERDRMYIHKDHPSSRVRPGNEVKVEILTRSSKELMRAGPRQGPSDWGAT